MSIDLASGSDWTLTQIGSYLERTVLPCRLACITDDEFPHVMSLWYLYRDGELLFSVQRSAMIAKWLSSNPNCGFEIASNDTPYSGVRGRATASVRQAADDEILRSLIERFMGDENPSLAKWLLSRLATEMTLAVRPHWLTSWDYAKRMS